MRFLHHIIIRLRSLYYRCVRQGLCRNEGIGGGGGFSPADRCCVLIVRYYTLSSM